jgi:hypothetical protein
MTSRCSRRCLLAGLVVVALALAGCGGRRSRVRAKLRACRRRLQ